MDALLAIKAPSSGCLTTYKDASWIHHLELQPCMAPAQPSRNVSSNVSVRLINQCFGLYRFFNLQSVKSRQTAAARAKARREAAEKAAGLGGVLGSDEEDESDGELGSEDIDDAEIDAALEVRKFVVLAPISCCSRL